jgi:hypothetical protein
MTLSRMEIPAVLSQIRSLSCYGAAFRDRYKRRGRGCSRKIALPARVGEVVESKFHEVLKVVTNFVTFFFYHRSAWQAAENLRNVLIERGAGRSRHLSRRRG